MYSVVSEYGRDDERSDGRGCRSVASGLRFGGRRSPCARSSAPPIHREATVCGTVLLNSSVSSDLYALKRSSGPREEGRADLRFPHPWCGWSSPRDLSRGVAKVGRMRRDPKSLGVLLSCFRAFLRARIGSWRASAPLLRESPPTHPSLRVGLAEPICVSVWSRRLAKRLACASPCESRTPSGVLPSCAG